MLIVKQRKKENSMFYRVLYSNPSNARDKEVRYVESLADAITFAPAGKIISIASLVDHVPADFVLYESARAELFL